jgi:sulfhydrogenase subunit gamma (sulfur reductase)
MAGFPIKLSITRIERHTPNVWSFFMVPQGEAGLNFTAGQVAVLEMEGYAPSYFAFASAPEDGELEFLVKRGERQDGAATVAGALFDPHIAKKVSLAEVVGRGFPVEEYRGRDLVFVAMGTGLAPLRSALRHIFHARGEYGRLIVLYGARTMDDFCYEAEMDGDWRAHGVTLRQVISRPTEEWSGPTGYVQSLLDNFVHELNQPVALVCGSPEMIEQTRGRLRALGFADEAILTNY